MFHLVLSVTVKDLEQHNRVYQEMGALQDQLAGEVPSVNFSSYDMTCTLPDTEELCFDERTMFKVLEVFDRHTGNQAWSSTLINDLLNAGILFRERRLASAPELEPDEVREGEESPDPTE